MPKKSVSGRFSVALQSSETWSEAAAKEYVGAILTAFTLTASHLDPDFPIRIAFAGAKHLILVLKNRRTQRDMAYHFENAYFSHSFHSLFKRPKPNMFLSTPFTT